MRKGIDDEAIIIRDKPGKIIGGLLSIMTAFAITGILGGIAFAYAQSATNAEVRTKIETLSRSTEQQDDQINKINTKVENVQKGVTDLQIQQGKMDTKIDLLLRNQGVSPSR